LLLIGVELDLADRLADAAAAVVVVVVSVADC
jgi:hypothetical protein